MLAVYEKSPEFGDFSDEYDFYRSINEQQRISFTHNTTIQQEMLILQGKWNVKSRALDELC